MGVENKTLSFGAEQEKLKDDSQAIWDAYNFLLLSSDIERLRKLVVRYDLFRRTLKVPGDIVECGVFKGTGLMLWLKLLQIHAPGSAKRVIGFDTFEEFGRTETAQEAQQVADFLVETNFTGISPSILLEKVEAAGLGAEKCELVVGDIRQTASIYCSDKPGLRVSLLHLDLDLESATYAALEAFWHQITPGGIVIIDNYGVPRWSESNAIDRFFGEKRVTLRTFPYSRTPTAHIVKE